jgi:hypothetical protein
MMPEAKKIELFAVNHNLRKGWLSLGNRLGEYYDWDRDRINCNGCQQEIELGKPRFKSRGEKNYDLCQPCLLKSEYSEEQFFKLENTIDQQVFHEWYKCKYLPPSLVKTILGDSCGVEPLWGNRFHCLQCLDLDLCEGENITVFLTAKLAMMIKKGWKQFRNIPELIIGNYLRYIT